MKRGFLLEPKATTSLQTENSKSKAFSQAADSKDFKVAESNPGPGPDAKRTSSWEDLSDDSQATWILGEDPASRKRQCPLEFDMKTRCVSKNENSCGSFSVKQLLLQGQGQDEDGEDSPAAVMTHISSSSNDAFNIQIKDGKLLCIPSCSDP